MNLPSTTSVTSSRESPAGPWPCGGPALKACPESGQAPAHVNRSVAPEPGAEQTMSGTCGQPSETSSELADLPLFSGSRSHPLPLSERLGRALARRLARFGSMEFEATWSQRATPLGLRYWAHTASARRTGDSGCTGWPKASARDWKDTPGMATEGVNPDGSVRSRLDMLPRVAALAGWPTPQEDNANNSAGHKGTAFSDLPTTAQLVSWPTPQAHDTQEQGQARELTATGRIKTHTGSDVSANLPRVAALAAWPTPDSMQGAGGAQDAEKRKEGGHHIRLQDAVTLAAWPTARANDGTGPQECIGRTGGPSLKQVAGWATPRAEDAESAGMRHSRGVADTLTAQSGQGMPLAGWGTPRVTTNGGIGNPDRACDGKSRLEDQCLGATTTSSPAATARPAGFRLNPRFSLWLMGYPDAWASCGERAMQSFRSARRSS